MGFEFAVDRSIFRHLPTAGWDSLPYLGLPTAGWDSLPYLPPLGLGLRGYPPSLDTCIPPDGGLGQPALPRIPDGGLGQPALPGTPDGGLGPPALPAPAMTTFLPTQTHC
jgi:hypothetical protein